MPGASRSRSISILGVSLLLSALASPAKAQIPLDLPAQPLGTSLTAVGTLGHLNVMFDPSVVDGLQAPALKAELNEDDALARLLSGTKLHTVRVDANTIRVTTTPGLEHEHAAGSSESSALHAPRGMHLAYAATADTSVPAADLQPEAIPGQSSANTNKVVLDEVLVTGTQIHGAEPTSQVLQFSNSYIEGQGFATVKDFIQSLPQNFNGGASENTISTVTGGGTSGNTVGGTGINLRGLGNDATLVLINGQRIAPGNSLGNWVDVSLIPLSAIQRVDVMPDSASAVYGSDAVGGVVNIILREDLEGAETRARFGSVTKGGREDIQASQAIGRAWNTGSALLVYDFDKATALDANSRDYTAGSGTPTTLYPSSESHSVLLTGHQDVGSNLRLFAHALYSHKSAETDLTAAPVFSQGTPAYINAYSATAGLRAELAPELEFTGSSNYSKSRTHNPSFDLYNDRALQVDSHSVTSVLSIDAKVDGTLLTLRTGTVRFALGVEYRRETYSNNDPVLPSQDFADSRNIKAAFAELHVPLVASTDAANAASALELEVADRYERYSDFGSTNNPKLGFIWRAIPGTKLRASYSTSFVAPVLSNLNPTPSSVEAVPTFDPITGSSINSLIVFGGNPSLQPQKSRQWTIGADFAPTGTLSALKGYLTYYRIHYDQKVVQPSELIGNSIQFLQYENVLGPSIIQRNPPASLVAQYESAPLFYNFGSSSGIGAIFDTRFHNLSSIRTSGIDFGISYRTDMHFAENEAGIDGTYIVGYEVQSTALAPSASFRNTPYNPIDLKVRLRDSIRRGPVSVAAYVNYIDSYNNPNVTPSAHVASWETVDMTAGYDLPWKGTTALLGVTNLLDKAPPYVLNGGGPLYAFGNFDGANANTLGRFVYLQLSKHW